MTDSFRYSCEAKTVFADPDTAEKVARRMRRKDRTVQSYRCPACRKWHIGTSS